MLVNDPFLMRMFDKLLLAAFVAFGGLGYAAESVKPTPSAPAVERDAETGQPGKPAAQSPKPPATELRFETPPVPGFMLRKPEKPLTVEEMKRQADEAAEKARRTREAGSTGAPTPSSGAESTGTKSR